MLLLDTHAAIWLVGRAPMTPESLAAIRAATAHNRVLISPVSAWEIGLLARTRRQDLEFRPSPLEWFARLLEVPGIRLTPLTPEAAIGSSCLPGEFHRDPADRMLIATARMLNLPIVTRDTEILAYAARGHVQAIAC